MEKKKQISLLVLGLFITIGMVVGVTYALWQITLQQTEKNIITTGCFNVTLESGDAITLNNAYPITDAEGSSLTPYTFTIKNNCSEKASYILNLETVSSGEKILSDEYVKASLKNNDSELFLSTLDSTKENLEKVIAEASKAYKLTEGALNANEEKTFELRLWMDENTPTIDEVMNASFMGKITITSSYVPYKPSNRMIAMEVEAESPTGSYGYLRNTTYSLNDKYNVNKVVYQNKVNPYEEAVEVVDFSIEQDQSVLGYYVLREKENESDSNVYTLYIQANGKIKVNPNGSYYGLIHSGICFQSLNCAMESDIVEGIENWDTSEVTNMSGMFLSLSNTNLNLSGFDTSNVTNMRGMFSGMNNLTNLDVSHFNTSKVTSMESMFHGINSITNLDVSSFDTSNVTDMSYMFSNDEELTNITYGLNFIHKEGANIDSMFNDCPANKPTHSSWNDVTW